MGEAVTDEDQKELFNERAGIREFDGDMDRSAAEEAARADVERHRHRCEIRTILRKYYAQCIDGVDAFIRQVATKRGADTAAGLRKEAIAQRLAGNRGKDGEWRELELNP